MSGRTYLDWNATAPLRPEARAAMVEAMDVFGNPSSVHTEGRAAAAVVSRARAQIAAAFGCNANNIIFTGSATEAASIGLAGADVLCGDVEHDCIVTAASSVLSVNASGAVAVSNPAHTAVQGANSETGVLQTVPTGTFLSDQVQTFGKVSVAFNLLGIRSAILSAHKIGGPKGVGALVVADGADIAARTRGGGQEQGYRSGTENVIGIAGFGAAAEAARRDLDADVWEQVRKARDAFENRIMNAAPDAIIVGKDAERIPNTSCIAVPGWKGETQVMQMDLTGFAISAGSACSSGKVKKSRVLRAMGFDDTTAASAIRVSIGPATDPRDLMTFADNWVAHYLKFRHRVAWACPWPISA
ncbi:MAG: aminotransferase class V-fold PLP-dependent enzyme [Rhodobacteraceae bacterium]|nr:aminotransferase class V-fold PLP-dependent enzyme [Paracoccaceae bacterium]